MLLSFFGEQIKTLFSTLSSLQKNFFKENTENLFSSSSSSLFPSSKFSLKARMWAEQGAGWGQGVRAQLGEEGIW